MAWSQKARQAAAEARRRHASGPQGGTPNSGMTVEQRAQKMHDAYTEAKGGTYESNNAKARAAYAKATAGKVYVKGRGWVKKK